MAGLVVGRSRLEGLATERGIGLGHPTLSGQRLGPPGTRLPLHYEESYRAANHPQAALVVLTRRLIASNPVAIGVQPIGVRTGDSDGGGVLGSIALPTRAVVILRGR